MKYYLILLIILIIAEVIYFRIANHFNIIDKPNERSSHTYITIRGGGIIFPIAGILWFLFFGFQYPWVIAGLAMMAVISFMDDIMTISSKIRILVHITAVSLLLWQTQIFGLPWFGVIAAFIFTIGWINAFNFMDGINGITAFYSLAALFSFLWINNSISFTSTELILVLIISTVLFSFFNARNKAKTFAGDIGSISMAFLLAWFMISLMVKTGRIEYILLFAVYGIDAVITIVYRIIKRDNIFKAHRSHLYQYLSNELGWSHLKVSAIYAVIQLAINVVALILIGSNKMNWSVFLIFFFILTIIYLIIRSNVNKKILILNKG